MLSQGDRRLLAELADHLQANDPEFAEGLRTGRPTPPRDDRRWPVVAAGLLAATTFLIALATLSLPLTFVALFGLGWAILAYRERVRRAHHWTTRPQWHRLG
ncbi:MULTISPECIES: DUF3040 domain-containing protein [unclassified Crossiella]|uniref:DUF3040 domain-containing protein n=1 Tax=unclassified Crossiella TaxID=2620835 RepID=UPI001FFFA769|nr:MULTISPECIES: DUF3040 domain-containing protein [unclassified Crossiella]MCK2239620.1 DUF3040 domain-containing protein [Crossiella sp. S99.2]MCK2252315.1 DUF3040 domain-containing protein [Crossiella sp. S99.1]